MRYFIAVFVIFILVGSACGASYFYMKSNHMTIPLIEKGPKEVMTLMKGQLDKMNKYSFEGEFNIAFDIKGSNLSRLDPRLWSVIPYGKVLGEKIYASTTEILLASSTPEIASGTPALDEIKTDMPNDPYWDEATSTDENAASSPLLASSTLPEDYDDMGISDTDVPDYPIGIEDSKTADIADSLISDIQAKITVSQSGKMDKSTADKTKLDSLSKIKLNFDNDEYSMELQAKQLDDVSYVNVKDLPGPIEMFFKDFQDKWIKIDPKESSSIKGSGEPETDSFSLSPTDALKNLDKDKERAERINKRVQEEIEAADLINFDQRFDDVAIDGALCYHYKVSLKKESLPAFMKKLSAILYEEMVGTSTQYSLFMPDKKSFEEMFTNAINTITGASAEFWIDKKTYDLKMVNYNLGLDISKFDLDGKKPQVKGTVKISGNMHYFNLGAPVDINVPDNSKSLYQMIADMAKGSEKSLAGAKALSRDAKRISDIKQIQTAVEIYFNDKNKYPESINTQEFTFYMSKIPTNPTPGGINYEYKAIDQGKNYLLRFQTENDNNGLGIPADTVICASMTGINVNCETEASERLVDSDNDGLNDWEEKNIYATNPLVPDTDKDGFLDGKEVFGGYDPLNAGAKIDYDSTAYYALQKFETAAWSNNKQAFAGSVYFSEENKKFVEEKLGMKADEYLQKLLQTSIKAGTYDSDKKIDKINFTYKKDINNKQIKLYCSISFEKDNNEWGSSPQYDSLVMVFADGKWMVDAGYYLNDIKENPAMISYYKKSLAGELPE